MSSDPDELCQRLKIFPKKEGEINLISLMKKMLLQHINYWSINAYLRKKN